MDFSDLPVPSGARFPAFGLCLSFGSTSCRNLEFILLESSGFLVLFLELDRALLFSSAGKPAEKNMNKGSQNEQDC